MELAIEQGWVSTGGAYITALEKKLAEFLETENVAACQSGTSALHLSLVEAGVKPGDTVIVPPLTFIAAVNPVKYQFATPVFIDVRPDTMNIDETKLEEAITDKTRAIMAVHYAGVACEMDTIMDIAARHNLKVIEDAAQGVMSTYKGRPLGTIGDFGCYSFHETKNYSMGEGGALIIRNPEDNDSAEILREKGTNRARFFRGQVDKYTWVAYGSSYLPSEMNAAYLWAQLLEADKINDNRLAIWKTYSDAFAPLLEDRSAFIRYMKDRGIVTVFHYVPLHSSPAGEKFGRFHGEDRYTTSESDRLVRLPLYYGLTPEDQQYVIRTAMEYFKENE